VVVRANRVTDGEITMHIELDPSAATTLCCDGVRGTSLSLACVVSLSGCPGGGEDTTSTTTLATTATTQAESGGGESTTMNLTTSISASSTAGADTSSTTVDDATASGSTASAGTSGSSSEGGFDCPMAMPDGEYSDCDMGCPGGNCLNIDGGAMGTDYRICNRGCLSVCNCWPPPEMTGDTGGSSGGGGAGEYTAELVCVDLETATRDCDVPGVCTCVLECLDKTCPAGMTCVDLTGGVSVCAFEVVP
jgi:hypothetical protein